jgi:hypothetical protein
MELWDVYNADRVLTGKTMVRGEPIQKGQYHLVVHACIFDKKGQPGRNLSQDRPANLRPLR